ncbi:hypothetical protein HSX11_16995 [Oxalobacteraceae bacterium]|nr:hypothetical protein [Oxalobacteraceae bacterium]
MKAQILRQWLKLTGKLDAMTLRERVMIFLAGAAGIVFLWFSMVMEPQMQRQHALALQLGQQQNQIAGIDQDITQKIEAYARDPDAGVRTQLKQVRSKADSSGAALRAVQQGLVAPDKMAPLLEQLLHGNGKLRLVSLKSLPVIGLSGTAPGAAAPGAAIASKLAADMGGLAAPAGAIGSANAANAGTAAVPATQAMQAAGKAVAPPELLYCHGVELVLQGGYLDMIQYMDALEHLPGQLFWGKARMETEQYPSARLTLTLYTLSLDKNWIKL